MKNLFPLGASVLSSESEERGAGNARDRCANLSRAERKMMHRSGVAVLTPVRVTAKRYSLPFALDVSLRKRRLALQLRRLKIFEIKGKKKITKCTGVKLQLW